MGWQGTKRNAHRMRRHTDSPVISICDFSQPSTIDN